MDADTSEKIRDVISFVHSRTLSIGVYSPGDISVTNMYEEAASDLAEIIQQEIDRATKDPFDYIQPCDPDCSPERHAYHQGQWDMAHRMVDKELTLKEHKEEL